MAKKLIPEELDALIQHYLTDGVLTEKERLVILRKAESMGLNRDEIDLYLDAEVQKIDQATDAAVRKQKGKTCPYCGSPVPQLAEKCTECGQIITPEASKELEEILEFLEDALIDLKSGRNVEKSTAIVERYARKAELYYSNNPKIKILLQEVDKEKSSAVKQAKRNSLINETIKNLKFWCALPIVIGLLFFFLGLKSCSDARDIIDDGRESKEYRQRINKENQGAIYIVCAAVFIGAAVRLYIYAEEKKRKKTNDC